MFGQDTIAAIATAPGEAAIGVIRISGPTAIAVAAALFHPASGADIADLESHRLYLGEIRVPETGEPVDQVILSLFRAPRSYTGEDVVEVSGHGGPVPLRRILALVLAQGARLAHPGEFTSRAFLNGKLDLAQAEAVMDVVAARTDRSLGVAIRQLEGRLSQAVRSARDALLPSSRTLKPRSISRRMFPRCRVPTSGRGLRPPRRRSRACWRARMPGASTAKARVWSSRAGRMSGSPAFSTRFSARSAPSSPRFRARRAT